MLINVVRLANGMLVGQTFSDRWNLDVLRADFGINFMRIMTKGSVDHRRRMLHKQGFTLAIVRGDMIEATSREEAAFGPAMTFLKRMAG